MRNTRQFLFLVLLAGLVLMREVRIAPLAAVESAFDGWLNLNSRRQPSPAPLAVVQLTGEDLRAMPWPWSPLDFSLILNAAFPFSPPVLALEPILDWPSPDPQQTGVLHHQLLRFPKVLFGAELGFPEDPTLVPPLQEVPVIRHFRGDLSSLAEFTLVTKQPGDDLRLAGVLGFQNLSNPKKTIARVPLVFRYRGQIVPSFVLQAAMLWYGVTPEEVTVVPGEFVRLGKNVQIPIDPQGTMGVDFAIPVTRFSTGDLLLSAEQSQAGQKTVAPVAQLKNSLMLLARTDDSSRTLRFPGGKTGTPGELFASAIATVQKHQFFRHVPRSIEFLVIFEAMILAWFCARLGKLASLAIGILVASVYLLLALGIFSKTLIVLPFILPLGLIAFVVLYRQLE